MKEREKMSVMAFLIVLSCSLIFVVVAAPFIDAQLLQSNIILTPPQYNIHFELDIDDDMFIGEYNASIYIAHETQDIYFNTENLYIIKTTVTNNTLISKENETKDFAHTPKKFTEDIERNITITSYPYNLSSGYYKLNVKFSGLIAEDGGFRIYKNKQNDRMWLAATHDHTFAIRRLFPLLRNTRYASYNISIRHHKSYTAISNMPIQKNKQNMDENNMQWTRFENTPLIPSYFITAIVAHLTVISKSRTTKLWCRTDIIPHVQFAYTVATRIAQFLDNVFLDIRKSSETNHIVIQKLLGEDYIKFGFVLYGEKDIIYQRKIDSEIRKTEITRVIGYKVVQEWFYNRMNPYEWEPWLSKGLATFFGIYIADKLFPYLRTKHFSVVQMQHDVLHWSTKNTWPLTNESQYNSIEIPHYIKASIMFRTLQILFTEKMFESGMKLYLLDHYTSSKVFWDTMQMDVLSFEIKYNITDRIASWTQLNHYPVINVERNYNNNSLNISVENFDAYIWIFVNITTQTHYNSKNLLPEVWLTPNSSYHTLYIDFMDKNDWVLANLQQSGCYRVNYDAENWNRLSNYLNSSFEKIHVLDRAKIIDDAFHFMMTGQLNCNIFLNISHYLSQDIDYIAWYPMFKNLEYISGFFAFPESLFIRVEIMHFMEKILWKVEYPIFDQAETYYGSIFTKCLRQEAAKLLCLLNHDSCLLISNTELKFYLSYRNTLSSYKIWTGWKEWTFCSGLKIADNDTWMQVFNIYLKESDSSVLKFLSCSQEPSIILQYIHLMANMTNVTAHINSFCTIIARHARTTLLQLILDHLEEIKPKEISLTKALIMIINHVYSEEQINEIRKYIKFHFKNNPEFTISYKFDNDQNNDPIDEYVLFNDNTERIIMHINRKIELRWHQIRNQLHEYRYLIREYGDTSKAS